MLNKLFLHLVLMILISIYVTCLSTRSLSHLILYSEIYCFMSLPMLILLGFMRGSTLSFMIILPIILVSAAELITTAAVLRYKSL